MVGRDVESRCVHGLVEDCIDDSLREAREELRVVEEDFVWAPVSVQEIMDAELFTRFKFEGAINHLNQTVYVDGRVLYSFSTVDGSWFEKVSKYEDPEFNFGDIVAASDVSDTRRWMVLPWHDDEVDGVAAEMFNLLEGGVHGSSYMDRSELPGRVRVVSRLKSFGGVGDE